MGRGVVGHGLVSAGMIVLPALIAILCAPATSYAAIYEFTLEGEVTATVLPGVNIGDPVTIRYIADTKDLDPRPMIGRYAATGLTLELPTVTYLYAGSSEELVQVNLVSDFDFVQYHDWVRHPQASNPWLLDIAFAFPHGTLPEALPLILPLSDAVVRRFVMTTIPTELFRGNITSYSSVEVPEPSTLGLLVLMVMSSQRSPSRQQGWRAAPSASETPPPPGAPSP